MAKYLPKRLSTVGKLCLIVGKPSVDTHLFFIGKHLVDTQHFVSMKTLTDMTYLIDLPNQQFAKNSIASQDKLNCFQVQGQINTSVCCRRTRDGILSVCIPKTKRAPQSSNLGVGMERGVQFQVGKSEVPKKVLS